MQFSFHYYNFECKCLCLKLKILYMVTQDFSQLIASDMVTQDFSPLIASEAQVEQCKMECGCCYADTDLEEMVQCSECHLFCLDCLKRYAEEAIHGQGKVSCCLLNSNLVYLVGMC